MKFKKIHRKGNVQIMTNLYIHTWSLNNTLVLSGNAAILCACHCVNTALLGHRPLSPIKV